MDINILFVVLLILTSKVYSATTTEVKDIQNTLALNILISTVKYTKNVVVSILPLEFSLCKLASVARGKAKEELIKAMGFSNDTMVNNYYGLFRKVMYLPQQTDLTYANKIYIDYNKNFNMHFAENASTLYGVHVDRVSYNMPNSAVRFINKGIASLTYRRVENVVGPSDINNLTSLLLITAGHFKPSWENHFDPSLTKNRPFTLLNNTKVEIPMMERMDEYQYFDAGDYRVVTIRLGSWGCSMTFVQPGFISVDKVLEKLTNSPDNMKNIRKQMKWLTLKIMLPRIKIKSQIDLDGFLQKVGIKEIFNSKSTELNAILKEGVNSSNMFVSKVRQSLFFEMDEFGVSRVNRYWGKKMTREHPRTLEIALDQPFYFTVNLELSHTISYELFNGVFYGPE